MPEGALISEAIALLTANPASRAVYVVDAEGRLKGTVSFRCILRVAKARLGIQGSNFFSVPTMMRDILPDHVEDIMRRPTPITLDTRLADAVVLLEDSRQNDLPIVDEAGRLIGELNALALLDVALQVFRGTEASVVAQREQAGRTGGDAAR